MAAKIFQLYIENGTLTKLTFSLTESESRNNFFKEELLPLASTILRLNSKLRPLARVSHTASRQLVAEFVMVVRDFKTQLESVIDRKANVSYLVFSCLSLKPPWY